MSSRRFECDSLVDKSGKHFAVEAGSVVIFVEEDKMAVIIKYVVERHGVEKMTFSSKAEADAYDKMLDTADALQDLLTASALLKDEQQTEDLALYLAQHKDALLQALGTKKMSKNSERGRVQRDTADNNLQSTASSDADNEAA